jgi:predicted TIM-barrel fold metal-dependent hydrolase
MIPIIDTHQHLWDLSRFNLPWLSGGGPIAKSYLMSDYLREAEGLNIVGTVYMEVDVAPEQRVAEAEYVIDLCAREDNPMVGAVIGGDPAAPDFRAYVERFAATPSIKGVRQVLHGGLERGYCLSDAFVAGARLLGAQGLRCDLCLRPDELADGAQLAALCPETPFVLDHCGNAPVYGDRAAWQRGLDAVAARPNVVCKISGIVAQVKPDAWGPEDWPVCTLGTPLAGWIHALQAIVASWDEADRRRLFHANAARFYALDAKF